MASLLFWITGFLPCRIISDGDSPYLERYYLCTMLGWRFYLHRFVGSDPDRGLHDHPWRKSHSIILSGWYWEETRSGTRKIRWLNSLTGDTFHRVVLPCERTGGKCSDHAWLKHPAAVRPCWTLFFHTAKDVKPWGFLNEMQSFKNCQIFTPYLYTREGSQKQWWLSAPKGKDFRKVSP